MIGMGMAAASSAMTIIGSVNQSAAQQAAGQTAYTNALLRNQQAQQQAQQMEVAAGQAQAASQRTAIQDNQRGKLMAGRAKAVMAASGAGVDDNLVGGLMGQGTYNANMDLYNGDEKARGLNNQAKMTRWSGDAGVWSGENTRNNADSAADATLIGGIAKGALSFASKYGGDSTGGPASLTPEGSQAISQAAVDKYGTVVFDPANQVA